MPNALAHEKSPYLLQHAENPVDWYPWGEQAFEKARSEDKPIFLSIGYSTCHWCHVMAHESFENEEVAKLLNAHFISIKVDREERPDVDRVYMAFVQATTGSGGWPMSVFLTPELKPFVGGTYFPPEDRYGRPGFATVLERIHEAWQRDRQKVLQQGEAMVEALNSQSSGFNLSAGESASKVLQNAFELIARNFDHEYGGFGQSPKFPHPVTLNFFFREWDRVGNAQALEMNLVTLGKMSEGGIYDQIGGGFHRYSVDRYWHIPHFEKMLYDQAQLVCSYLEAFQITGEKKFEVTARETLGYVRREMCNGGFYSAEDADSRFTHESPAHGEGAFYVWTKAEIDALLGADAEIFNYLFGVEEAGNAPEGSDPHGEFEGKNTLIQRHSLSESAARFQIPSQQIQLLLARSMAKLFEARAKRPRPHLDDKIITAWNGLMISAFARAAQVLGDAQYLEVATEAAQFLATHLMTGEGKLLRSYRQGPSAIEGFAEDYAFFIQGLLDLYEAGFDWRWLELAERLQLTQDALFGDPDQGGYFGVTASAKDILVRTKDDYDGAEPAASSVAALNLWRLGQFTGEEQFRIQAGKVLSAFAPQMERLPQAMPQMLAALAAAQSKPLQIVIAGDPQHPQTRLLLREVHKYYLPNKVLFLADGNHLRRLEFLRTAIAINGQPVAYVCENFVCQLPVTTAQELSSILKTKAKVWC